MILLAILLDTNNAYKYLFTTIYPYSFILKLHMYKSTLVKIRPSHLAQYI